MNTTITDLTVVNIEYVEQIVAREVVEARATLAAAKAAVEKAETAFLTLGTESVTLDDGTKVAIVQQERRSIDQTALRNLLPTGQYQRVTVRQATLPLLDEAVKAGWLDTTVVECAINAATVTSVKVTTPKRK